MAANKPEILVSSELRQTSMKFQLVHLLFRVDASTGGMPTSPDVGLTQKSNMAGNKPELLVSPKLRQILSKFQLLHLLFLVDASTGGTADVSRRRSLPEIQHGRQQTRNTSISETTTDIIEIPTAAQAFTGR